MKESSRIWNELVMAKHYTLCISKYTSRQRKINQWVDIVIVSLSILSIVGYYFHPCIPIGGVVITLIWKYAKSIFPFFKQSEKELTELDALHTFYESYLNRLEHFWYLQYNSKIDDDVLMSLFFREKESEANKKALLNKLQKKIKNSDSEDTQREAEEYLNQVFKSYETDKSTEQST